MKFLNFTNVICEIHLSEEICESVAIDFSYPLVRYFASLIEILTSEIKKPAILGKPFTLNLKVRVILSPFPLPPAK